MSPDAVVPENDHRSTPGVRRHAADADPSRLDRDAPDDLTHNTRDDPDDEPGPDEETGKGDENAVPTEPPPE